MKELTPQLIDSLKHYSRNDFVKDLTAGVIVAIIALPLSIALALASGVSPEQGLYTAITAGFLISALGGSKVQIAGPTAAFATIVAGIVARSGLEGLATATILAGVLLILMGLLRMGSMIRFIPYTITTGFTAGIAVTILIGQLKDFFGLTFERAPVETMEKLNGVRLTFKKGSTEVVLDKYVESNVDDGGAGKSGGNIVWSFRILPPQELGALAGQQEVELSARLIYESGKEGFLYAQESMTNKGPNIDKPVSLIRYDENDNRRWSLFRSSGGAPIKLILRPWDEMKATEAPRMGSFFTVNMNVPALKAGETPNYFHWPKSVSVNSTRAELWTLMGWSEDSVDLRYDKGESASRYVPRELAFYDMSAAKLTGDVVSAVEDADGNIKKVINIPAAVPVIGYASNGIRPGANYISLQYTVNQAGVKPFFALAKQDKTGWSLQKFVWDEDKKTGRWEELEMPPKENEPEKKQSYDEYIASLKAGAVSAGVLTQGDVGSCQLSYLETYTQYCIYAYYWNSEKKCYQRMNQPGKSGGSLDLSSQFVRTNKAPEPTVTVDYGVNERAPYDQKYIRASVSGLGGLGEFYYVLELLDSKDSNTPLTCLGVVSNRMSDYTTQANIYGVGRVEPAGLKMSGVVRGLVYDSRELVVNPGKSYPELKTEGKSRWYPEYGKTYYVRARLYEIGFGPAYGGDRLTDDILRDKQPVDDFTVTDRDDKIDGRSNFDLVSEGAGFKPVVSFTLYRTPWSGRLRYDMATAVLVRARLVGGKTEYADVTDQLTGPTGNLWKDMSSFVGLLNSPTQTLQLDVSGAEYQPNDEFTLCVYGILDGGSTAGAEQAAPTGGADGVKYREEILCGRLSGGSIDMSKLLSAEELEVEGGKSVLLYRGSAVYTGASVSAGKVALAKANPGDDRDRTVRVTLTDPVQLSSIRYAQWQITATYTASGSTTTLDTGLQEMEINNQTEFILDPTRYITIPEDNTSLRYAITLRFFTEKRSGSLTGGVPMTPASSSMTVVTSGDASSRIYTLTGTLEMKSAPASFLSTSLRSFFGLLPDNRKRGL